MPHVTVTVDGAIRRSLFLTRGQIVRDDFREADHPRAGNGQFGSGGSAHIVTTSDGETTTFHHVGTDKGEAHKAYSDVEDEDDGAEYHAPKVTGPKGERADAVHIVHSPDGAGGTDIHGVHTSEGAARAQAVGASRSEWEENGPTRSEVGLSDLEKTDVAQAWNEEHAGDHDDVRVKVDGDGDPILDGEGDFQFVQDGEDVDPGDDIREAFDVVSDDMYSGDDTATYPGLEEANNHFEAEGRHESVFRIHTHRAD